MQSHPPYKPLAFANEFISLAAPNGVEHMKLQKLVYYAYGWWLAYRDEPIMTEAPEVWKHGPVFPSLFNVLKGNGGKPIVEPQQDIFFAEPPRLVPNEDAQACQLARWIWKQYSGYSSFQLSDLSHEKGSPWEKVASEHGYRVPFHTKIPKEIMQPYFKTLAAQLGSAA